MATVTFQYEDGTEVWSGSTADYPELHKLKPGDPVNDPRGKALRLIQMTLLNGDGDRSWTVVPWTDV